MKQKLDAPGFSPSILVVDDDPLIQKVFGHLLNKAGYACYEACNGVEGRALIRGAHFDLMILDLAMPEMDGFEVLQFARSEVPDLKIIVVSGFMQGRMLKAAKLFGAVGTLEKPVEGSLLLSTVRNVLSGQTGDES